jgi:hypothetical protein
MIKVGSSWWLAFPAASTQHERQYEAWKGELLAAVWGMKSFRVYLLGQRV